MHSSLRRILTSAALFAVAGAVGCSEPSSGNGTEQSVYGDSLYDQSKLPYLQNAPQPPQTQAAQQAQNENLSPVDHGHQLYTSLACVTCHTLDGRKGLAPTWKGIYGREETLTDGSKVTVNDAYIKESILNPTAKLVQGYPPLMPNFSGRVTPQDVDALIAFMKTIK